LKGPRVAISLLQVIKIKGKAHIVAKYFVGKMIESNLDKEKMNQSNFKIRVFGDRKYIEKMHFSMLKR